MGNICRSPSAEGFFRQQVEAAQLPHLIKIDSAGTHAYHVGEPPDERAQMKARQRGIDLSPLRARQVQRSDFVEFDYIIAMDQQNYALLHAQCPPAQRNKLHLFLSFAPETGAQEVPDPYYGGDQGFEQVLDLIEAASVGLLNALRHQLPNTQPSTG
jgi:protein-tyrosine phosphatase